MTTQTPAPAYALPDSSVIPGPPGHPVLGMAQQMRTDLLGMLLENFERYGDFVAYRIGPARGPRRLQLGTVAVHHPDAIQRVLSDTDTFTRYTSSYKVLTELFGQNLVTSNGPTWVRQKRTLQPLFTRQHVQHYADMIRQEASKVVDAQDLSSDEYLDVAAAMEAYALRVLGHTLFKDEEGIDDDVVDALARLVPVVGTSVRSRASSLLRLPLDWPTPGNKRFVETRTELYATVDRVLAKRAAVEAAPHQEDLLTRLAEARDPETGGALSSQEIRDQALIFLLSGHTTTSNALTSTLYLLGRHPEAQEEVAAAARAGIPDDPDNDLVRAAVQEGMRLYPPSYVIGRRVLADAELLGRRIPAGTNVLVSPYVTHRHPEYWEDPLRYDPWRFMGPQDRPQYAYFPFGGGGRACIGKHFAMLESTILVRELLTRYRIEALDADVGVSQLISLRPSGPVRVRCTRREEASR